jgi:hypothetical protein
MVNFSTINIFNIILSICFTDKMQKFQEIDTNVAPISF